MAFSKALNRHQSAPLTKLINSNNIVNLINPGLFHRLPANIMVGIKVRQVWFQRIKCFFYSKLMILLMTLYQFLHFYKCLISKPSLRYLIALNYLSFDLILE